MESPILPAEHSDAGSSNMMSSDGAFFTLFPRLPSEIRAHIWKFSLQPRIVKWIRSELESYFTVPSRSLAVLDVCQESREVALLVGGYKNVSTTSTPVYFSPTIDYLFFDPGWTGLVAHDPNLSWLDPLNSILPGLENIQKIMVHPHYTDTRKRPTALLERFTSLKTLLVAADEKSIGLQSKFMLSTVYDLQKYYSAGAQVRNPDLKAPYIAVGCLGWAGEERRRMYHGDEDGRQLVAVFDNSSQMRAHLAMLREEEWRFTQEQFHRRSKKPMLKFRRAQDADPSRSSSEPSPVSPGDSSQPCSNTTAPESSPAAAESSTQCSKPVLPFSLRRPLNDTPVHYLPSITTPQSAYPGWPLHAEDPPEDPPAYSDIVGLQSAQDVFTDSESESETSPASTAQQTSENAGNLSMDDGPTQLDENTLDHSKESRKEISSTKLVHDEDPDPDQDQDEDEDEDLPQENSSSSSPASLLDDILANASQTNADLATVTALLPHYTETDSEPAGVPELLSSLRGLN